MQEIPPHHNVELVKKSYLTNNNFAYKYDTNCDYSSELKFYNFVTSYDPWCLGCSSKTAKYRCSDCKSVYFCGRSCQKKCWKVHKKHCKRNIFCLCMVCGSSDTHLKCDNCPVKFCSEQCKNELYKTHKEFDCDYFQRVFGKKYLNYE